MVWVGIAWHGTKGDRMGEWDIDKGMEFCLSQA